MLLKPQRSGAHLPTFEAYAEDWISSYRGRAGRGIEELTRQDYRDNLKRNAYKTLGSVRLDRIDAPMLRGFVADLDARGLSHNTIRLAFAPVRLALTQAFDDGLVNPNPAAGIKTQGAKRRKSREKRTMTREQFIAFIAAISDPGDRLLVRFALETGLRISEVVPLRWCDVENGAVTVWRKHRRSTTGTTKTPAAERTVPISPAMMRDLVRHRNRAEWIGDRDLVWPSATGTPRHYSNLYTRVIVPAREAVGMPWVSWHTLRRTCATLLVTEHGFLPAEIQAWLGHEDPYLAQSLYTQLTGRDLRRVAWTWDADTVGVAPVPMTPTRRPRELVALSQNA